MSKKESIQKIKAFNNLLVAHQLTSTLTAIKWSLKMLFNGDFGKVNKEQKDIIEKIIGKNQALISLVDKLLNTAKIEEGKYSYSQSLTSMENIVKSVIDYFQDEAIKKKIKIEFKKPKEKIPKIMLDAEMVKLAIQNIFDNAIKYTMSNGEIKVFLKLGKKDIELQVQDSGIGIPEKQKDKLFDKFFRGNNVNKINAAGSGVGLFIAKSIIEAHNGKIWFESKENKGSTFCFSLPL